MTKVALGLSPTYGVTTLVGDYSLLIFDVCFSFSFNINSHSNMCKYAQGVSYQSQMS